MLTRGAVKRKQIEYLFEELPKQEAPTKKSKVQKTHEKRGTLLYLFQWADRVTRHTLLPFLELSDLRYGLRQVCKELHRNTYIDPFLALYFLKSFDGPVLGANGQEVKLPETPPLRRTVALVKIGSMCTCLVDRGHDHECTSSMARSRFQYIDFGEERKSRLKQVKAMIKGDRLERLVITGINTYIWDPTFITSKRPGTWWSLVLATVRPIHLSVDVRETLEQPSFGAGLSVHPEDVDTTIAGWSAASWDLLNTTKRVTIRDNPEDLPYDPNQAWFSPIQGGNTMPEVATLRLTTASRVPSIAQADILSSARTREMPLLFILDVDYKNPVAQQQVLRFLAHCRVPIQWKSASHDVRRHQKECLKTLPTTSSDKGAHSGVTIDITKLRLGGIPVYELHDAMVSIVRRMDGRDVVCDC